jgi:hypothetical protein
MAETGGVSGKVEIHVTFTGADLNQFIPGNDTVGANSIEIHKINPETNAHTEDPPIVVPNVVGGIN